MWVFDVGQQSFREVVSQDGPTGRSFFGFTAVNSATAPQEWTLIIFGGCAGCLILCIFFAAGNPNNSLTIVSGCPCRLSTGRDPELADTWAFNVSSSAWKRVDDGANGHMPSGRAGLSLTSAEDGGVYLFGGGRFDWDQIETFTEPLLFDTIVPADDCSWVFNPVTDHWSPLTLSGEDSPAPRAFAGFTSTGQSLYLFGGLGYGKKLLNDLWEFDVRLRMWTQLQMAIVPSTRYGMSLVADISGDLFIIGGSSKNTEHSTGLELIHVTVPKTHPPPENALQWLQIYDQDTIDFTEGSDMDSSRLRESQDVSLCQGSKVSSSLTVSRFFPCSIRIKGDASYMPTFPYNLVCDARDGCIDIRLQAFTVECHNTRLQAPLFELFDSKLQVVGSHFQDCALEADSFDEAMIPGEGAIIRATKGSLVVISASTFRNCSSRGHGGVVALFGSALRVQSSAFVGCTSFRGSGGAIWAAAYEALPSPPVLSEVLVSSSDFFACSAHQKGGAISASSTTIVIIECTLDHNKADAGGALAVTEQSSADIESSTFRGNKALGQGGAALRMSSSRLEVLDNSFHDNVAERGGGGVLLWDGDMAPTVRMSCSPGWFADDCYCKQCPPGSFKDTVAAAACTGCDAGKYSNETGMTVQSACLACPVGKYQNETGASSCLICRAGTYSSSASASACRVCDVRTYQDAAGASACNSCPHGSTSPIGSSSPTDCRSFEDLDTDGDLCISEAEIFGDSCPCSSDSNEEGCDQCRLQYSFVAGGDDCISPEDWDVYIDGGGEDGDGEDGEDGSGFPAFEDLDADEDLCISEAEAGCPCSDCDHCSQYSFVAGGDDCISPEDWDVFTSGSVHGGGDGSDDGSGICAEAVCVHVVRARACHHSAPTPV